MKLPTIIDTRGNRSQTLFFVAIAATAVLGRFIAGMFTDMGLVSSTEFATAFTTIMAPWVAREAIEKLSVNPSASKGV